MDMMNTNRGVPALCHSMRISVDRIYRCQSYPKVFPLFGWCGVVQARGQFADSSYTQEAKDFISFDCEHDRTIDHIGIVVNVENELINTIERNNGKRVKRGRCAIGMV